MSNKPVLRYFLFVEKLKTIDDDEGSRLVIIDPLTDVVVSLRPTEVEFYMTACISNLEEHKNYAVEVKVCLPNGKKLEIYGGGFKTKVFDLTPTLTYYTEKPIKLEIVESGTYEFSFYLDGEMLGKQVIQVLDWLDTVL